MMLEKNEERIEMEAYENKGEWREGGLAIAVKANGREINSKD